MNFSQSLLYHQTRDQDYRVQLKFVKEMRYKNCDEVDHEIIERLVGSNLREQSPMNQFEFLTDSDCSQELIWLIADFLEESPENREKKGEMVLEMIRQMAVDYISHEVKEHIDDMCSLNYFEEF